MNVAGRSIRAGWTQIGLYLLAYGLALQSFASHHEWGDLLQMRVLVEFLIIVAGVTVGNSARSPIGRKDWTGYERAEKTLASGTDTPPSK